MDYKLIWLLLFLIPLRGIWRRKSLPSWLKQYFLCDNSRLLHKQNSYQIHGRLLKQAFQDLPTWSLGEIMVNQAWRSSDASSIGTASSTEIVQWVVAANNCLNSLRAMIKSQLHLHLLYKQRQQSDRGGYLAKESYKHCTQLLLQVIRVTIE